MTSNKPPNLSNLSGASSPFRPCSEERPCSARAVTNSLAPLPMRSNSFETTPKDSPNRRDGSFLARNAEAAGDNAGAAAYYQRIFFDYPASDEAADAETALARLKAILAENFPPAMPQVRLGRAARLARGGQAARARQEYASMASDFGGIERDLALVRAAAGNFRALEALRVTSVEADAERIYSMHAAARRAKMPMESRAAVDELGRRYPKSRWRLQALISQANDHLIRNEISEYEPLYRTCYQEFRDEPEAAYCHWKVAWASYLRREGKDMFEEHLRLFPQSDKASAALYYLGRRAELVSRYPLSYYSTLSRQITKRSRANSTSSRARP